MDVVISGSTGLIGTALVDALVAGGHRPIRLVRRAAVGDEITWDPSAGTIDAASLEGVDALVHLAGAGIGDKRWTAAYKRTVLDSRVQGTGLLARTLAGLDRKPKALLSGSAIGYYGDRGDEELTETSTPGTGFLAEVCWAWEAATQPAVDAGIRVCTLRTGIVLSTKGGALRKQLPLFRLGLGGRFGNGRQWQSWISIDDEVGAIIHALGSELRGPVNLTAPTPVTNADFATVLGHALHRPSFLPIPAFGPKLLLGGEMADALLFTGQKVRPTALIADGFAFTQPTLAEALATLLARRAT